MTIPKRCPCCDEVIDAYGCVCTPSKAWPALSDRTGRIDLNPGDWHDDVDRSGLDR